jgi:hypothetical protein
VEFGVLLLDFYVRRSNNNIILIPVWNIGHLQSLASGLYSGFHFLSLTNPCHYSFSAVCCQLFWDLPCLLCPCEVHSKAFLGTESVPFLRVWPSQPNFLPQISKLMSVWLVLCRRCILLILLGHDILRMWWRHWLL